MSHRYLTLKQISESDKYPFTRGALQQLFSRRYDNGLAQCCYLFGNKFLVREDRFDQWIESHQDQKMKAFLKAEGMYVEEIPE